MESSRRLIQLIRTFLLVSIVLYAGLAWTLPSSTRPNTIVFQGITVVAISMLLMVFGVRRIRLRRAEQGLLNDPENPQLLRRWREGYLLTYVFCEAIALYGIALHFLGNSFLRVAPFFIGSFGLILFFRPSMPAREFPPAGLQK